jgi:hypothetical protein
MNIKALIGVMLLGTGGTVAVFGMSGDDKPTVVSTPTLATVEQKPMVPASNDGGDEVIHASTPTIKATKVAAAPSDSPSDSSTNAIEWNTQRSTTASVSPPEPVGPQATERQLDALLAPIALYPDQLLSQILMAATYPLEVIEAARWSANPEHSGLTGEALANALESEDWDPSVKALVAFPQTLKMLDADPRWLGKVGDAFLDQETAVMDSVQRLRREARDADRLATDTRQRVTVADDQIMIEPANPEMVYVPFYDPAVAYGVWPYPDYPPAYIPRPAGFAYTPGVFYTFTSISPFWNTSRWDWRQRRIHVNHAPRGPHRDGAGRDRDDNRGRDTHANNTWRHDPSRDHGRPGRRGDGTRNRDNVPPPIVIQDRDFPEQMKRRGAMPQRGQLPDASPPLPASSSLPAIAPPVSTTIGVSPPSETMRGRNRDDSRRRYDRDNDQGARGSPEDRTDTMRRQRQFQDRSISAPPLTNVPPQQQQQQPWRRDQSISAPPVTNTNIPPQPEQQRQRFRTQPAPQGLTIPPVVATPGPAPVQGPLPPPQRTTNFRLGPANQPPTPPGLASPPPTTNFRLGPARQPAAQAAPDASNQ